MSKATPPATKGSGRETTAAARKTPTTETFQTPDETPSSHVTATTSYFPKVDPPSSSSPSRSMARQQSTERHPSHAPHHPNHIGISIPTDPAMASTISFPPLSTGHSSEAELLGSPAGQDDDTSTLGHGGGGGSGSRGAPWSWRRPQSWRELRGRLDKYLKINGAGAQVASCILMTSLFTLINPLEDRFPTNTVYLVIATVVIAAPNQTISVRLYAQRLIGVVVAGLLSLIVLGLDALIEPRNCLECSYKPYAVGLILFFFIYCSASVRESIPGQAYTSKLTDLTFVITLLGAYDDLRKDSDTPRYATPLARMASMVVGLFLTMIGSSIFWPIRVNLVHRVITGNLFKDMSSYLHDLIHEGYLQDPSRIPLMTDQGRMSNQWGGTVESIAVPGGMDVIGSEEAAAAPRLALDRTQRVGPRTAIGMVFGSRHRPPPPSNNEERDARRSNDGQRHPTAVPSFPPSADPLILDLPASSPIPYGARQSQWELMFEDALDKDGDYDLVKNFHEKTHPAAVHIIRTLEKERARLEASYQVEVRWTQRPHFIRIGPLNQVIRRLRLLFYQLTGLYSDRLITLRALSPRFLDSAHISPNSSMSVWVSTWMADAVALLHVLHASSTDPNRTFTLEGYSAALCNALVNLGEVVLWTTTQGHRIIGAAELAARLAVTVDDVLKERGNLEEELLRLRALLMAAPPADGDGTATASAKAAQQEGESSFLKPQPHAAAATAAPYVVDDDDIPQPLPAMPLPTTTRVFGAATPPATSAAGGATNSRPHPRPLQHGLDDRSPDPYEETRAILAFQYGTYVKLWEITEVVLSAARAVGKLVAVYS
ncbi:hypothetical protein HDU89_002626 [Geranomyces variabilis]|nr:hypothetical protein HDU89_002626 [Geranomyces variabilis]